MSAMQSSHKNHACNEIVHTATDSKIDLMGIVTWYRRMKLSVV